MYSTLRCLNHKANITYMKGIMNNSTIIVEDFVMDNSSIQKYPVNTH